jgi:IPT/TIG domain
MTSNRVLVGVFACAVVALVAGVACSSSSGSGAAPVDAGIDVLGIEPCLDTTIEPASGTVAPGQTDAIRFEVEGPGTPPMPTLIMWTATGGTLPGTGAGESSVVWTAPSTTGTYTIELLYQPIGGTLMCVDQIVIYVDVPSPDGGGDDSSASDDSSDDGGDDSASTGDDANGDDSSTVVDAGVDSSLDSSSPPVDAASDTSAPPPTDGGGTCARDGGTPPSGPPTGVTTNVSHAGIGAPILVSGTNLDALAYGATLTFPPGVGATGVEEDSNGIWFDVPATASTGIQTLTYATCAGSTSVSFTVDTTPAPSVTSFTPSMAMSGQTIVVNGAYFTGATQVWLAYFAAPATYALPIIVNAPQVVSDSALTFQVPTIPNDEFRYVLVVTPSGAGASTTELELSN